MPDRLYVHVPHWQDNERQDKTRQDKTRQDKTRRDETRRDETRRGEARQGKARQGKAIKDKTRQDKTRQGEARQDETRWDETRRGEARRGNRGEERRDETRRDKTRQGKARQDKTRRGQTRQDKTRRDEARRGEARRDQTRQDKYWSGDFLERFFLFDPSLTSGMSAASMQGHCLQRRPNIKRHMSGGWEFHRKYHRQLPPHLTRHETLMLSQRHRQWGNIKLEFCWKINEYSISKLSNRWMITLIQQGLGLRPREQRALLSGRWLNAVPALVNHACCEDGYVGDQIQPD